MSDMPTGDNAALLLLVRELSGGMQSLREAYAKQTEDVHEVKLGMAEIKATLQPVAETVGRINDLSTRVALLESRQGELDDHEKRILTLEATAHQGQGWQSFGGKLLYLVGGAAVSGIVAAIALALRQ